MSYDEGLAQATWGVNYEYKIVGVNRLQKTLCDKSHNPQKAGLLKGLRPAKTVVAGDTRLRQQALATPDSSCLAHLGGTI
jgi:hypothetical protein